MENSDLINEYTYWDTYITTHVASRSFDNKMFEIAFLKIYVKFERFISELFIQYSAGVASSKSFVPERKLCFTSPEHVQALLKSSRASFIEYTDKIENVSDFIFLDNKNPFTVLLRAPNREYFNNAKIIRNYISHESNESRVKYQKMLGENRPFVPIGDYLATINRKKSKSNYTILTEFMINTSNYLIEPKEYF